MANRKSISARAFMESFHSHIVGPEWLSAHTADVQAHEAANESAYDVAYPVNSERPVQVAEVYVDGDWHVLAVWADGAKTLHGRYEVRPTRSNGHAL